MRYLFLSFGFLVGVYLVSRSRSDMQKIKPKKEERVSPKWLVQHAYDKDGDAA